MRFMPEHEALKTMSLFEEASESQKISKSSLMNWAVSAIGVHLYKKCDLYI